MSVVIPTYNRADYLAETLDSVLAQTLADLEVIVVDDCSSDDTLAVLERYGDRVQVIVQPINRGPSAARNVGLAAARGELIAFVDSDDTWWSDKLARQVQLFDEDPTLAAVTGTLRCIDEAGTPLDNTNPNRHGKAGPVAFATVIKRLMGAPSSLLMRAEVAAALGPFDENMRYAEDIDYYLRLATRTRWLHTADIVGHYRVHAGNISNWGEGLARADVQLYEKWSRIPLPAASLALVRASLALSRYKLAALQLELDIGDRRDIARLYVQAALGDPLVDSRIYGRSKSLPARAWQLSKPWMSAAASFIGLGAPLRRSIRAMLGRT